MMQKQAFLKPDSTDELPRCNTELIPTISISQWSDLADLHTK